MRIEHIALNVPHATEHAQWYMQHLGLKIVRQMNDATQMHFLTDDNGQVMIELYTKPGVPVPDYAALDASVLHVAFSVDDLPGERDRLLAAGATSDGGIDKTPNGDNLAFLRDPWGLTIQLVKRKQALNG